MGICFGVAAMSQHTPGPQHMGHFKMLRDLPRQCWVRYCRVSFLLTAPRCLPLFLFPGDFLADVREHWPGF